MAQRPVDKEIEHRSPVPQSPHPLSAWVRLLPPAVAGVIVPRHTAPGPLLEDAAPIDAIRAIECW